MYTLSIQKVNWFFSRNYLLSLTRSNEGYKFIKCDCWRWKMCLRLKRKKIANQFYLELSSKRARACCKQLREFQWGEENIHYVEQDLFIHAQIFRQQFFNSFRAPHSPVLALSIEWLASTFTCSLDSIDLSWRIQKENFAYLRKLFVPKSHIYGRREDDDDEYEMKKIVVQFEKKSFAQHLKRKFHLSWEFNFIHFLCKNFSFQYIHRAAMLWFYNKNQKTLKYFYEEKRCFAYTHKVFAAS